MKPELFKISFDAFRAYAFDKVEQRGGTGQISISKNCFGGAITIT